MKSAGVIVSHIPRYRAGSLLYGPEDFYRKGQFGSRRIYWIVKRFVPALIGGESNNRVSLWGSDGLEQMYFTGTLDNLLYSGAFKLVSY